MINEYGVVDVYREVCSGTLEHVQVDLNLTLSIYNFGFWYNGRYGILFLDDEANTVAIVEVDGKYRVYSRLEISCRDIVDKIEWMLGLREDLSEFHRRASKDPLLSGFFKLYRGWRVRSTSLWLSLVIGVCQQNASFRQGWTMLYNIVKSYGKEIKLGDKIVLAPPTPRDILSKPELLTRCRVGYRARTIVEASKWIVEKGGVLEELYRMNSEEVEELLKTIKGIGSYTARLALILGLRKYDLPPIDRWLAKIIEVVYGVERRRVEDFWRNLWREYSGLASLAVTITLDAEPLSKAIKRIEKRLLTPILDLGKPTPMTLWKYFD